MEPNPNVGTATPTTAFYQTGTVHIQSVDWLPNENTLQLTVENEFEWNLAKRFLFTLEDILELEHSAGESDIACLFEIWEYKGRRDVLYVKNKESQQGGIQQCINLLFDNNLITKDRYKALLTEVKELESTSLASISL
ncbi:MAG: hypothetical protein K0R66_186 [Gammaproteobacteria bacterium]|nr:hypothetical protein [Gammaproteobacteria bacterium]